MSKHEELKTDIQNCFKLLAKYDNKYDVRYDELKTKQGEYVSDVKLLSQGLENIVRGLEEHIRQFQKHNDEEMLNYKNIQDNQAKTASILVELKSSIDNEISQNKDRDEKIKKQSEIITDVKNTQTKYIRIFAYVGGSVSTILYLINNGFISINFG